MYAEVCAYLTVNRYFELPTCRVGRKTFFFYELLIFCFFSTETFNQFYSYLLFGYLFWHVSCRYWNCDTF